MKQNIFSLVFLIGLGVCLLACGTTAETEQKTKTSIDSSARVRVEDTRGKEISLAQPARRVVCLFDPLLQDIYMFGAQACLVGVPITTLTDHERFDYYKLLDERIAQKTMATPGSRAAPDIEAIIRLQPDLVILDRAQESVAEKLEQFGIPVYLSTMQEYDELIRGAKDLGILLGRAARADSLIAFVNHQIDSIRLQRKQAKNQPSKSAYFTWANGRILTTTGKGMMHDCIELAAMRNVCPKPLYRVPISPETLIQWNPDIIITWNDSPSTFYNRKEFQHIKAIKQKQIYNLEPMFLYNLHNLETICAIVKMYSVAYGNARDNEEVKRMIRYLYPPAFAKKLTPLL